MLLLDLAFKQLIESRAAALRQQIKVATSDYNTEKLRERLAKLVGSICAIRVGGISSVDRTQRRYKIETALHSAEAALTHGVVAGGGVALWRSKRAIAGSGGPNYAAAYSVVAGALEAPLRA